MRGLRFAGRSNSLPAGNFFFENAQPVDLTQDSQRRQGIFRRKYREFSTASREVCRELVRHANSAGPQWIVATIIALMRWALRALVSSCMAGLTPAAPCMAAAAPILFTNCPRGQYFLATQN